jgi:hypothetical protein
VTAESVEQRRTAYGLASATRLANDEGLQLRFEVELTEHEYTVLNDALQVALRLGQRDMYRLVVRNYEHLDRLVDFYVQLFGKARSHGLRPRDAAHSVMESAINWLNATRLFLDHEETWLKRQFGEDSHEHAEFTKARSNAFDSSFAYRFLYKLRDYTTHCGLPIGRVRLWAPSTEDRARGLSQRIHFELDRDALLNDFKKWGAKVKPDLEQMPETFELLPLVHDVMPHFNAIMETIIRIDIREGVAAAATFAPYMDRIAAFEGGPVLLKITPPGEVSPLPIPAETLTALSEVDLTGDVLDPFRITASGVPSPTRALNDYYKERIGRAVEIIKSFIEQDGATDGFHQRVGGLLGADGNVEPIITGLTVVSANAIGLAASTIGVSPETVLAYYGIEDR